MEITYKCKLCGKPGTVHLMDGEVCDEKWMEIFRKMLVCNPCSDLRNKFRGAEDRIMRACSKLSRLRIQNASEADAQVIVQKCRRAIELAVVPYAEAMAAYRSLPEVIWSQDLVNDLVNRTGHAASILKAYRDDLKKRPRQQTLLSSTNDP